MRTNSRNHRVVGLVLVPFALLAGAASARAEPQQQPEPVVVQPVPAQPVPVVVQPAPAVQAQPAPVQAPPATQKSVTVQDRPQENFMMTIAKSSFFGLLTGVLVGGAFYFIDTPRRDAEHIGYWAAGGALVGVGVGVLNIAVNHEHAERAISRLESGSARRSFGVRLVNVRF